MNPKNVLDAVAEILREQQAATEELIARQAEQFEERIAVHRADILAAVTRASREYGEKEQVLRSAARAAEEKSGAALQGHSELRAAYEARDKAYQEQLAELKRAADAASERMEGIQQALVQLGEKLERAAVREEVAEQIQVATQDWQQIRSSVSGCHDSVNELSDRITALGDAAAPVRDSIANQAKGLGELRASVAALTEGAEALRKEAAEDQRRATGLVEGLSTQAEAQAEEIAALARSYAGLDETLAAAIKTFDEKNGAALERAEVAGRTATGAQESADTLRRGFDHLRDGLSALGDTVGAMSDRVDLTAKTLADDPSGPITEALAGLEEWTGGVDNRLMELESRADALQEQQDGVRAAIEETVGNAVSEAEERLLVALRESSATASAAAVHRSDGEIRAAIAEVNALATQIQADFARDSDSIASLKTIDGRRTFLRGAYGREGSSLYRCRVAETKARPSEDDGAWETIAAGIDDIIAEEEEGLVRLYAVVAGKRSIASQFRVPFHRGGWKRDAVYHRMNFVTRKGSTWLCDVDETSTEPGSDSGKGSWRLVSQRGSDGPPGQGERGARGLTGARGDDGVGVADILHRDTGFAFVMTDGEVKEVSLS